MKNVLRPPGRVRDREAFRSHQVAAATAPQAAEFLIRKKGNQESGTSHEVLKGTSQGWAH